MDRIRELWETTDFPVPTVLVGYYNKRYYAVTSNSGSVVFFAATNNKNRIYAAVKSKCIEEKVAGGSIYNIKEGGALQVVSCTSPYREVDIWAVNILMQDPELTKTKTGIFRNTK